MRWETWFDGGGEGGEDIEVGKREKKRRKKGTSQME